MSFYIHQTTVLVFIAAGWGEAFFPNAFDGKGKGLRNGSMILQLRDIDIRRSLGCFQQILGHRSCRGNFQVLWYYGRTSIIACPGGSWEEWGFGLCSVIFVQNRGRYMGRELFPRSWLEKDWRTQEFSRRVAGKWEENGGWSLCNAPREPWSL